MRRIRVLALAGAVAALAAPGAAAEEPTVVELFTSQSCDSCPPAEAFLGKLAGRADLVALELHVDYWNELVDGRNGKWRDPFSSPAHAERQTGYNVRLRGKAAVYTPQMVIDGRYEEVGSRHQKVEAKIREARAVRAKRVRIEIRREGGDRLKVSLADGPAVDAGIWLVTFKREQTTRVDAGENKGANLTNHNVVTGLRRIGEWTGNDSNDRPIEVADAPADDATGCAVIVQADGPGPILGAARCPGVGS